MKCLVINLDRSADRLAYIGAAFERLSVGFQRFPATDGAQLSEAVLDRILIQFGAENISVAELREKKLNERDPLKAFSVSCRRELQELQRVI